MTTDDPSTPVTSAPPFRTTLVRVLVVQVIALVLLWVLQLRYHV